MPKQSYFEGWGYTDTIKLLIKGKPSDRDMFYRELKSTFPKDDISKVGNNTIEAFVYEKQIPAVKKMARIFKMRIAYEGGGGTADYTVQKIILEQLGGQGKLRIMTGAHNFVAKPNGLWFKIKNRKINYVEVVLNSKDLYDMKFGKIILGKQLKVIAEHNDLYFDQLIPTFEKETGMYLKLFKKGGFVSTQNRDMVLSQLKSIHHHEQELLNSIKSSPEIEAWVLAKVQRATTDLSDVAHYIDGKTAYKTGGSIADKVSVYNNKYKVKIYYTVQSGKQGWVEGKEWTTLIETNSEAEAKKQAKRMFQAVFPDVKVLPKNIKAYPTINVDLPKFPEMPMSSDDNPFFKRGGKVYLDLFEDYENIPTKIQVILDKYSEDFEDGNYEGLAKALKEVEEKGYTFDYYLDGVAYGLRPINVKINELKGYEEFAQGGMPQGLSVADANPYIAGAKAVKGIAPQSVSALDQRLASKINPDPNRPVFF